jgi:putative endonuclease
MLSGRLPIELSSFFYQNNGGLAQLARALAWHARGHRFDSGILHRLKALPSGRAFIVLNTMFYTYIIYSPTIDQFYIGHCQDLQERLYRHNNSRTLATKKANDWVVVYSKQFDSRKEANYLEMIIKRKKSRKYIEWLISQP